MHLNRVANPWGILWPQLDKKELKIKDLRTSHETDDPLEVEDIRLNKKITYVFSNLPTTSEDELEKSGMYLIINYRL